MIKYRNKILFIISILLIIFTNSCKKDCYTGAGEESERSLTVGNFNKLNLSNNFIIHLIQDSLNIVEIKGNKNIIDNISAEINEQTLSFKNQTNCSLFKGYHKQHLYIHFTQLEEIFIINSPEIYSADTLRLNHLFIEDKGDIAKWNLIINANNLHISLHAIVGEMTISGICDKVSLYTSGSNHCLFENLQCRYADINHSSAGNIYLSIQEELHLQLFSSGNFYCFGNPLSKSIRQSPESKGEIIFKTQ